MLAQKSRDEQRGERNSGQSDGKVRALEFEMTQEVKKRWFCRRYGLCSTEPDPSPVLADAEHANNIPWICCLHL